MKHALLSEENLWRNKNSESGTKEKRILKEFKMKD